MQRKHCQDTHHRRHACQYKGVAVREEHVACGFGWVKVDDNGSDEMTRVRWAGVNSAVRVLLGTRGQHVREDGDECEEGPDEVGDGAFRDGDSSGE
jgi:hypothetical protein